MRRGQPRATRRGQALVEFALILPILALLLVMAVDFGRVFFGWVALNNMARAGANLAATRPYAWSPPGNATDQAAYQTRMQQDASAINCTGWQSPLPTPSFINVVGTSDPHELGDSASVRLACRFQLLTPLASNLLGGTVTISATAIFPIRQGTINGLPLATQIPSPSASASSSASAAPTPSPSLQQGQCEVPQFFGDPNNSANLTDKWATAGFQRNKITIASGTWTTVGSQSLVAGAVVNCNSSQITVGP